MIEFYEQIKLVHIAAVSASGSLFALRGLLLNLGYGWVMAPPIRWVSYTIDTVLLTAALMLTTITQQYPFVDTWLTVKVVLLAVYIVLGFISFWRARTKATRLACWLAALAVFGFIVSVARAHDPLGFLAM
ncbi:SirB2 family protein [Dongia sp.]|uniref:SirB2 family protein n=1 Tax=Dongia sp. TaxID=1977262 RepID=UPI0035B434AE